MNIIEAKLINYLKNNPGGIPLDKFIEICLFEKDGYYKNIQPIGKLADFITAPEISQLFGEILGLYIYNIWENHIQSDFNLIELGPGKGTLLNDILRINKNFKLFLNSINLNLIEINEELIKLQKENLSNIQINQTKIQWLDNLDYLVQKPSIFYANEFFDCLAVKQFININKTWHEKKIKYNKRENNFFIHNTVVNSLSLSKELNKIISLNGYSDNQVIEISESRKKYFNKLCNFIKKNSGAIIIIDYGYLFPINHSTLQSLSFNRKTNILDNPGRQDITSLVNFNDFLCISKKHKLNTYGPITQKNFLQIYGIEERKKKILLNASEKQKDMIEKGYYRLISNSQMGNNFKFLIVSTYKLQNA